MYNSGLWQPLIIKPIIKFNLYVYCTLRVLLTQYFNEFCAKITCH